MEALEGWEKPMNVGKISPQQHQYSRKAKDFQWPCTITMKGSMPTGRRWVIPPF